MPSGINAATGKSYRFKDRTGIRNGRLVFTRYLGQDKYLHAVWEAQCDCGRKTETTTPKITRSCGCLQKETVAKIRAAKRLSPEKKKESILNSRKKQRAKRNTSPLRAMQARLSRLHRHAIARVGALKTSPTFEHLGYTVEMFVKHIESQFVSGMSWENMKLWQIDHIIPISEAKTVDDVISLNQLYNLRPMWAKDNNAKRNRITSLL